MDELAEVGMRLRAARQARGWTLDELASRANVSASTLSRLESGKRQASLELLLPLTRQLGIRVDDLLPAPVGDPRVRRREIRRHGQVVTPLTVEGSPVQVFRIEYPPREELPEPRTHDGSDWLYVVSGRLRVRLGDEDFVLARGEAAEFDCRTPHAMAAVGARPAEVLSIFNDAGMRIHLRAEG